MRSAETVIVEAISSLVRRLAPEASIDVMDGDPGDLVPQAALRTRADLIVAGSHQKGFWSDIASGGGSRAITHDAPCTVYLVTPAAAKRLLGELRSA